MNERLSHQPMDVTINQEGGVISVAPAASATIVRSKMDLHTIATTPATGVGTLQFPYPQEALIGVPYFVEIGTDGGGEVKIADPDGNDIIGDNIGAAADKVVFYSTGRKYVVLIDVTN